MPHPKGSRPSAPNFVTAYTYSHIVRRTTTTFGTSTHVREGRGVFLQVRHARYLKGQDHSAPMQFLGDLTYIHTVLPKFSSA